MSEKWSCGGEAFKGRAELAKNAFARMAETRMTTQKPIDVTPEPPELTEE